MGANWWAPPGRQCARTNLIPAINPDIDFRNWPQVVLVKKRRFYRALQYRSLTAPIWSFEMVAGKLQRIVSNPGHKASVCGLEREWPCQCGGRLNKRRQNGVKETPSSCCSRYCVIQDRHILNRVRRCCWVYGGERGYLGRPSQINFSQVR